LKYIKSNDGIIIVVDDIVAIEKVKQGSWSYCNKNEWIQFNKTNKTNNKEKQNG
jgi:hypothetical protein